MPQGVGPVSMGASHDVRALVRAKADPKELMAACDRVRDHALVDLGVRLEDKPDGEWLLKGQMCKAALAGVHCSLRPSACGPGVAPQRKPDGAWLPGVRKVGAVWAGLRRWHVVAGSGTKCWWIWGCAETF
eukprot:542431-Pelagomonas_calceolata.AAC.4